MVGKKREYPPGRAADDATPQFTVVQLRALHWRAATGGESRSECAVFAGVTDTTIWRWLQDPIFASAWADAAGWFREEVKAKRRVAELVALDTLLAVQLDENTAPNHRIDAAKGTLTAVQRAREHEDTPKATALTEMLQAFMLEGMKQYAHVLPAAIEGEARVLETRDGEATRRA